MLSMRRIKSSNLSRPKKKSNRKLKLKNIVKSKVINNLVRNHPRSNQEEATRSDK